MLCYNDIFINKYTPLGVYQLQRKCGALLGLEDMIQNWLSYDTVLCSVMMLDNDWCGGNT